jgi:hypothetical protein
MRIGLHNLKSKMWNKLEKVQKQKYNKNSFAKFVLISKRIQ